jgi:hypothetical protein
MSTITWRRKQLEQAGVSPLLAIRLAHDSRYDLHRLLDLLEHGCSPELAVRILAPLEEDAAA